MPAVPRTPRSRWIDAGLDALASSGPGGVRVEVLAATLGVTKGGFYGLFGSRPELLDAMLDEWERRATDDVLRQVDSEGGSAADRMRRAGALTFSEEMLPVDLAVRAWARTNETVAARLRRVDNVRIGLLRELLGTFLTDPDEIEARSMLAFATAIGHHFMAADHGAYTKAEALALASSFVLTDQTRRPSRGEDDGAGPG
jgi:AcrR family transcriptional regulator